MVYFNFKTRDINKQLNSLKKVHINYKNILIKKKKNKFYYGMLFNLNFRLGNLYYKTNN